MDLYNQIKDEAMKIFNERGFEGTTIREICKRAGVTAPSIYLRYGSKEKLYTDIFYECRDKYFEFIKSIIDNNKEKNIKEQLFQVFRGRITYYSLNEEGYKFYFRAHTFPVIKLKNKLFINSNDNSLFYFDGLSEIIQSGIKEKIIKKMDMEQLLKVFCTMIKGYIFLLISQNENPKERDILTLWNIFWTGIKY